MGDIYTGIDLGTDSIKIVVTEKVNDKFQVLASVSSPSNGIKNGFIVDTKMAVSSVKNALPTGSLLQYSSSHPQK